MGLHRNLSLTIYRQNDAWDTRTIFDIIIVNIKKCHPLQKPLNYLLKQNGSHIGFLFPHFSVICPKLN